MDKSSVQETIHVIGTDPEGPEKLPPHLQRLIISADNIASSKRLIKNLRVWLERKRQNLPPLEIFSTESPTELLSWLNSQTGKTIILSSGDPLWFGIGRQLLEEIPKTQLKFHPSPTSLQLAFSRIGRSWQDATWVSLHGRDPSSLSRLLQQRPKALAVLTDPNKYGTKDVREILRATGLEASYSFWLCELLGSPNERVQEIKPTDEIPNDINPLHLVVLIANKPLVTSSHKLPLFGIKDGEYVQHEDRPGLMTKREVRIQLLADLDLPENGVIWDLGAGVGTVGLEAVRLRPKLQLMAVEKRSNAKALIEENATILGVKPTSIFQEEALNLIKSKALPLELAHPDRVILGGGFNRINLLKEILKHINPKGIIVIPLITLESISELKQLLESSSCSISINQHQSSRGVSISDGTRLSPMNPVFILKGSLK